MHKNGFVAVVKSYGKILREFNDSVKLPFDSEYSILLKNLHSTYASVKVEIDGENVLENSSLIILPNCEHELKGYVKNNIAENKFKFIEKTDKIQEVRQDNLEDGLIKITYQFEKGYYNNVGYPFYHPYPAYTMCQFCYQSPCVCVNKHYPYMVYTYGLSAESGITVPGSKLYDQYFNVDLIKNLEEQINTIIFTVCGYKDQNKIKDPITTKDKFYCVFCGGKLDYSFSYCPHCGNFISVK